MQVGARAPRYCAGSASALNWKLKEGIILGHSSVDNALQSWIFFLTPNVAHIIEYWPYWLKIEFQQKQEVKHRIHKRENPLHKQRYKPEILESIDEIPK